MRKAIEGIEEEYARAVENELRENESDIMEKEGE